MIAVLGAVFITAVLATLWVIWPQPAAPARWERPGRRAAGGPQGLREPQGSSSPRRAPDSTVGRLRRAARRLGRGLLGKMSPAGLERTLLQGGIELSPGEFCLLVVLSATLGATAGLAARGPGLAFLGAVAGLATPVLWMKRRRSRRVATFERQLPDALAMLAGALRAGQSFLQAVDTVSRETGPPLGPELTRLVQETQVNVPLDEALRHLSARVGSPDLDLVVAAVSVQREAGGNLSQVVERVGQTIRERLRLRGEIRILTAQGRLSGMIIGALPLALGVMIWWLNPGYLDILLETGLGRLMLGGSAFLVVVGFLVVRKLVSIDM